MKRGFKMFLLGWLSPEGKMYECEYLDHIATAEELCSKYGYTDEDVHCDDILMKHGWVHLSMTTFFSHSWIIMWNEPWKQHLTIPQKHFLKPYIEKWKDWLDPSSITDLKYEFDGEVVFE
jgi:hypothetical protein